MKDEHQIKYGRVLARPIFEQSDVILLAQDNSQRNTDRAVVVQSSLNWLKEGDMILLKTYSHYQVNLADGPYYILGYEDILGVFTDEQGSSEAGSDTTSS